MSPWINDALFAFIGSVIVCVAALVRNPRDPRNLSFAGFASACAAYSLASLMVFYADSPDAARIWGLRTRWWFVFTPFFLLAFALYFADVRAKLRRPLLWGTFLISAPLSALTFTPYMVSGYVVEAGFTKPIYGPAYKAFAILTILVGGGAFGIVLAHLRTRDAYLRARIKLLLAGVAAIVGGSLLSFPLMHRVDFPLTTVGALVGLALISYSFLTERVWGMRSYLRQVLLALLLGAVLILPIIAGLAIALQHAYGHVPIGVLVLLLFAVLGIVWSWQQVRGRLDAALDRLHTQPSAVQAAPLLEAAQRLAGRSRVDEVANVTVSMLEQHTAASHSLLFLDRQDGLGLVLCAAAGSLRGLPTRLDPTDPGVTALLALEAPTVTHLLRYERGSERSRNAVNVLHDCCADLVVPLGRMGAIRGLLMLGPAADGQLYEPPDLAAMKQLSQEINTALQSANTFQAEQVDRQIEHISRWISMIAHEFRNALLPARSFLEMLEEPDDLHAFVGEYRADTLEQLERAFALIGELRRLQIQRPPRLAESDLRPLLDSVLRANVLRAREQGVELRSRFLVERAPCAFDAEQLRQALVNLVGNALQHARSEPVLVELGPSEPKAGRPQAAWQIAIHNAEVIDPHLLPLLFTPFFSTRSAEESADAGFGLGMPIAQRIVLAHGGSIDVRSVLGQGTIFLVHLPAADAPEGA